MFSHTDITLIDRSTALISKKAFLYVASRTTSQIRFLPSEIKCINWHSAPNGQPFTVRNLLHSTVLYLGCFRNSLYECAKVHLRP
ncbi:hypothetical protein T07_2587 [Trichinella nelsoni]|uniref:Uncharacterized protein n=1 Tax=Trichinella nelsoni TaxID=6336 RepID=A0A0V0RSA0_9BILA|nr:hypothetical protein T07_2773 [Trichinella nelsoni]KRX17295.1 hypothetical protein T07_2587 [Trichinella nelsoni]